MSNQDREPSLSDTVYAVTSGGDVSFLTYSKPMRNEVVPRSALLRAIIVSIALRQLTSVCARSVTAFEVPNGMAHHVELFWCACVHACTLARHDITST